MSNLLLVIDVQKDFVNDNTRQYVKKIQELINLEQYDNIVFTKFINSENSIWYKKLGYKGCLNKVGQDIVINTKNYKVFEKTIYSALNDELEKYLSDNNIERIYLCGFDTDACIQKTALDLFENGYEIYVLQDYCMSHLGVELHNTIIDNLKILIGKDSII